MKYFLITALFVSLSCLCAGQGFKCSDVPLKDGAPYYEQTIPLGASADRNEVFHAAQLFFAEYFKKSTPEVKIEDKADGRLAMKVNLFYKYLSNPDFINGRCLCITDITIEPERCIVRVYDLDLYHKVQKAKLMPTAAGAVLVPGNNPWERTQTAKLYQDAAKGSARATAEMKAIHTEIGKLMAALEQKIKGAGS